MYITKKVFPLFLGMALLLAIGCTTSQVNRSVGILNDAMGSSKPLTSAEVSSGLKEALVQGITKGVGLASAKDGFLGNNLLRIPFPPEAKKVENTLRDIGLGSEVDKFITSLNRGAEDAAKSAKPIFVEAIRGMSITDAFNILRGEPNAATQYLRQQTEQRLINAFRPIVENSLQKVNATRYYGELVGRYNRIPLVQQVNPDLAGYATQKAIDGLFVLVQAEEGRIRRDATARTTDLLKKVFGSTD